MYEMRLYICIMYILCVHNIYILYTIYLCKIRTLILHVVTLKSHSNVKLCKKSHCF